MNTAKTLQLLDLQSNNISPATNIESIYYEVMDGGVIYRNSLYRHFPIYVKYNNNIDDPIVVNRSTNSKGIQLFNDTQEDTPIGNSPSFRLSQSQNSRNDIFVSSIRQSQLKNTRYYKLDISTYNFSDIMSLYAPKLWVKNKFDALDSCIGKITYDSSIIATYSSSTYFIRTTEAVGNIEEGTLGSDLTTTDINGNNIPNKHIVTVNELLDKILFKETYPYIFDASIYMEEVCTSGNTIIVGHDIQTQTDYKIILNPGKLQIVFNNESSNIILPEPIDTKLKFKICHIDNETDAADITTQQGIIYTATEQHTVFFNDCSTFYNDIIEKTILPQIYTAINTNSNIKKTPNIDYDENDADSVNTWNIFEQNVINTIKNILKNYFSTDELNQIDWKEIIIKNIYTNKPTEYPRKGQTIRIAKFQKSSAYSIESTIGQCFANNSNGIFNIDKMFEKEYYVILKNKITISSDQLNGTINDNSDKTNFGNPIQDENYYNIYNNYILSYNDYYNPIINTSLEVLGSDTKTVNTSIELYHKFVLNVPIIINNKTVYITGSKDQYIDFLQDTAEDIVIKIPGFIDGSNIQDIVDAGSNMPTGLTIPENENLTNLPELYAISQGGVFMPANNWKIDKIELDNSNIWYYHKYTIKAQKPYDDSEQGISNKRTIKIKIHTKYSNYYESLS